ncbi:hypothetical protein ACFU5Y_36600 [Streptomyces gardneri]|uniref:hypothetical protein n=1 Tax=Streptomyces gardneri TaxID=66892 RepID=UPI003678661A
MIDFASYSTDDFLEALRNGTDEIWAPTAAVWLLEQHGHWITDPTFRRYTIGDTHPGGDIWAGPDIPRIHAAIDAGEFGEWREDLAVLRFALSLYADYPISLRYVCENLSEETIALMGTSLSRANGY